MCADKCRVQRRTGEGILRGAIFKYMHPLEQGFFVCFAFYNSLTFLKNRVKAVSTLSVNVCMTGTISTSLWVLLKVSMNQGCT